jgi:hypothetical protein
MSNINVYLRIKPDINGDEGESNPLPIEIVPENKEQQLH